MEMKRCDICQGSGSVHIVKRDVQERPGYNTFVIKSVKLEKEQCPKCDGKGIVKKDA